jgi:cytochrome c5
MENQQDKNIEAFLVANQRYLFKFVVNLVLITCIGVFMYGLFGDSMSDMFDQPEVVSEEVQKKNRQKRKATAAAIAADDMDRVENGIHVQTGFVYAEGFDVVRGTCTACHSAKLVTQNRATREGWKDMIRWMQKTQGLWELGKNEPIILDYLAKHYAPDEVVRRPGLDIAAIEWYILDLSDESIAAKE